MSYEHQPPFVLIADDDPDDQILIREAFQQRCKDCHLLFFVNGVELLSYLRQEAADYTQPTNMPFPDLLLLDLNMPLKDGRQSLLEINADPVLCKLPTVGLTTSRNEEDKAFFLANGARDYIVKPTRYSDLLSIVERLKVYWSHRKPEASKVYHD